MLVKGDSQSQVGVCRRLGEWRVFQSALVTGLTSTWVGYARPKKPSPICSIVMTMGNRFMSPQRNVSCGIVLFLVHGSRVEPMINIDKP